MNQKGIPLIPEGKEALLVNFTVFAPKSTIFPKITKFLNDYAKTNCGQWLDLQNKSIKIEFH